MSCSNSDILALIDYFENGTDLSSNKWDNYNYYDLWNALENGAPPPSRTVCATFTQADILSVTLAVLGTFTTPSEYLGFNRDFYYLYLKAIGSEDPSPTFTNECIGALYDVFTVNTFTGLLDNYPGAAAAYSIRLLSSTYSGALVEIRRSGDNAINSFYPDSNNELSLNSTDVSGTSLSSWISSENGFVRTWYDQSGNSNNATQTSAASQSQIISSGALLTDTSKPCFVNLNYPLTTGITLGDFTISWVTTRANTFNAPSVVIGHITDGNIYAGDDTDGNGNPMFRGGATAGFLIRTANGNSAAASDVETTPHISAVYRNGISCGSKFNATNSSTSNQNSTTFSVNKLGYINSFPSYNFQGNVQEIVIWDSYKDFEGIVTEQNTYFNKY